MPNDYKGSQLQKHNPTSFSPRWYRNVIATSVLVMQRHAVIRRYGITLSIFFKLLFQITHYSFKPSYDTMESLFQSVCKVPSSTSARQRLHSPMYAWSGAYTYQSMRKTSKFYGIRVWRRVSQSLTLTITSDLKEKDTRKTDVHNTFQTWLCMSVHYTSQI